MIYYIFLDVDGVLNDEKHIEECYEKNGGYPMSMNHVPFDPNALTNLMNLVKRIRLFGDPRIILSSTWRLHDIDTEIVSARIAEYGLRLYDRTPCIHQHRGTEIERYLQHQKETHPTEEYKIVILDDDKFDIEEKFANELICVDRMIGLQDTDIQKAFQILEIGENNEN